MDIARFFRIASAALVTFIVVVVVAVGGTWYWGGQKMQRTVKVPELPPVAYADDAASIAHGKYLYLSRGCMECHGANGAGKVVFDEPNGFYVRSPDLTSANPAIANYRPQDWDLAIRHGVASSGRPLLVMPSEDYNRLSNEDFAALVGYLRSLPPTAGGAKPGEVTMPWYVRGLYGAGVVKDAAEKIDHALPPASAVAAAPTVAYGAYVANACMGCHGASLRGGKIPGAPPDWPDAANLHADSRAMKPYEDAAGFVTMMRTGKRPDGTDVSRVMPFASFAHMNDTDLDALYLYLRSLK